MSEYGSTPMGVCPRFSRCNAPICPLDPEWRRRSHLPGDAVCAWLLERAKPSWETVRDGSVPKEMRGPLEVHGPEIIRSHARIRREVERASTTGSKVLQGRNLRKST